MKSCENCRYRKIDEDCLPCSACIDLGSDLGGWVGLTNADRIRAMSDEELAEWVANTSPASDWSWWLNGRTWLEWLKSPADPAKEGEG